VIGHTFSLIKLIIRTIFELGHSLLEFLSHFLIFLWYFYFNLHFLYSLVFVCLFLTLILTTIFFNYMILSLEQLLKSSSDFQLIELARSFAIIRKLFLHFFRKNRDAILKMFLCNCWKNTFSLNIFSV